VRLTNLLKSDGDYYVLRLVGYGLCGIHDGEHNETVILGSAYVKGKDSVCSTTRSKLALEHVIIHELSHNLGAHHYEDKSGACNDAFCVMSRTPDTDLPFYEDVWIDYWCSTCKSNIEDTLFPDDTY
jgi:predicted Zn-dependent protease